MKTTEQARVVKTAFRAARCGAFTLPELMVAMTVFSLLLTGVIFAHLYGLSMFKVTATTLNATDEARKAMGKMTQEIRTCRSAWIGNVNNGVFAALLNGESQQGSGLLIYPTTNTSSFIIYFRNPSDQTFRRTTSTPGSASILAECITNTILFSAENFQGTVQTNNSNNRVIHFNLEFYKPRSHQQMADYYKLETAMTRRAE